MYHRMQVAWVNYLKHFSCESNLKVIRTLLIARTIGLATMRLVSRWPLIVQSWGLGADETARIPDGNKAQRGGARGLPASWPDDDRCPEGQRTLKLEPQLSDNLVTLKWKLNKLICFLKYRIIINCGLSPTSMWTTESQQKPHMCHGWEVHLQAPLHNSCFHGNTIEILVSICLPPRIYQPVPEAWNFLRQRSSAFCPTTPQLE